MGDYVITTQMINSVVSEEDHLSLVVIKPVFGVFDLVRHKPGCAATEDS